MYDNMLAGSYDIGAWKYHLLLNAADVGKIKANFKHCAQTISHNFHKLVSSAKLIDDSYLQIFQYFLSIFNSNKFLFAQLIF